MNNEFNPKDHAYRLDGLDERLRAVETTVTECKLALAAQSMKLAELIQTVNTLIREVNKR